MSGEKKAKGKPAAHGSCRECARKIPRKDARGNPVHPRDLCGGCFKALYPGYGVSKDNLPYGIHCPWCGSKARPGDVDESGNFFYPYCAKCDLTTMVHMNPKEDKISKEEYQIQFSEE